LTKEAVSGVAGLLGVQYPYTGGYGGGQGYGYGYVPTNREQQNLYVPQGTQTQYSNYTYPTGGGQAKGSQYMPITSDFSAFSK
jgi:hypothetical protein